MVINGAEAIFPSRGRSLIRASAAAGETRVEATLVQGSGKPGTWRFELGTGLEVGSLRVIAGEVVQLAGDTVVFRMKGTPGERVVFAFRVR